MTIATSILLIVACIGILGLLVSALQLRERQTTALWILFGVFAGVVIAALLILVGIMLTEALRW